MDDVPAPDDCVTMRDVRAGVDAVDRALVALLAERFAYMRAAARIKPDESQVRDEARKAEVVGNVRAEAARLGLPAAALAEMWDALVEASITYEMAEWQRRRR